MRDELLKQNERESRRVDEFERTAAPQHCVRDASRQASHARVVTPETRFPSVINRQRGRIHWSIVRQIDGDIALPVVAAFPRTGYVPYAREINFAIRQSWRRCFEIRLAVGKTWDAR